MQQETVSSRENTPNIVRRGALLAGLLGVGALAGFVGAEVTEGSPVSSKVIACEDLVESSVGQRFAAPEIAPCDDLHMVSERIETFHVTDADLKEGRDPSGLEVSYRLVEPDVFDRYIAQRAAELEQTNAELRRSWVMGGLAVGIIPAIGTALYMVGRRPVARLFYLGSSHIEHDQHVSSSAPQPTKSNRIPAGQGRA